MGADFHILLFGFVICAFMWWILQLHLYVVLNFLPIVADPTPYVPTTNAVVTDLDQLAAFILSGLLVLLGSLTNVVHRKLVAYKINLSMWNPNFRSWCRTC